MKISYVFTTIVTHYVSQSEFMTLALDIIKNLEQNRDLDYFHLCTKSFYKPFKIWSFT